MAAYQELLDWHYNKVALLDGGFNSWSKLFPIENSPAPTHIRYERYVAEGSVSPQEFKKLLERNDTVVLDVRTDQEVERGMIKGAMHIPLSELDKHLKELPRTKEIVIHCVNGIRAQIGYSLLKAEGFEHVKFLNSSIVIEKSGKYVIVGM